MASTQSVTTIELARGGTGPRLLAETGESAAKPPKSHGHPTSAARIRKRWSVPRLEAVFSGLGVLPPQSVSNCASVVEGFLRARKSPP